MHRFAPTLLAIAAFALSLGAPRGARAQDDEYHASVTAALAEYERGNYDEALVLFRRAHALQPSARTLRGLGNVCFELRRYVEAVGYYDDALESTVNPLTEEQRAEVSANLERAAAFVGRLTVEGAPDGALVVVDGAAFTGVYTVGEHEVAVTAEGFEPFATHVSIDGGADEVLTVVLVPIGGTAGADSGMEPAGDGLLVPALVVMGIGVATLGGFGVLGGLALDEQSRVEAGCGMSRICTPDDVQTLSTLATGADVLLGIGSAIVVAGAVMLIVDPPHGERPRATVVPVASTAGAGLVVGGSW